MSKRRRSRKSVEERRKELGRKRCPKCKLVKNESEFGHWRSSLSSWCKDCHREYSYEYRKREGHRERHAKYMSEYRKRKRREAKEAEDS